MKPYYSDKYATIYHGDCLELLPEMPKVDLVLTDPPYGIGYDRNKKHSGNNKNNTVVGDDTPFDPRPLLIFDKIILWGANCYSSKLPNFPAWLCWRKTLTNNDKGQTADFELAWSNCLTRSRYFEHLWAGAYRASESGQYLHTTQKPVDLMLWCIGLVKPEPQTILDPFMGSGTTLVAAKQLNRQAIGIEIDEKYCEIGAKRLSQEVLELEF